MRQRPRRPPLPPPLPPTTATPRAPSTSHHWPSRQSASPRHAPCLILPSCNISLIPGLCVKDCACYLQADALSQVITATLEVGLPWTTAERCM